jgi:hypothetical protein
VTYPEEGLQLFGQKDHVRMYGSDFLDKLKIAGFIVRSVRPDDFLEKGDIDQFGNIELQAKYTIVHRNREIELSI